LRETRRRIGEQLVADGALTEATLSRALGYQRLSGDKIKLGSILLNWDLLEEDKLLAALARLHRSTPVAWPLIASAKFEVVQLLPAAFAHRANAIAYALEKGVIRIAFVNPSDIGAVDEAAAITGRRVIHGVTTELRMLQAHQRFYGRYIPLEYRAMIQKVQRKTSSAARPTAAPSPLDFRAGDLVQAERDSPEIFSIPVVSETKPGSAPESEPIGIAVPQMPAIAKPASAPPGVGAIPPPPPLAEPEAASVGDEPFASQPEEAPAVYQEASTVLEEALSQPSEESLAEWVGEALASLQQDSPTRALPRAEEAKLSKPSRETDPTIPIKPTSPHPQRIPETSKVPDPIANMWQPAPPGDPENVVSSMWSADEQEPAPLASEARSRDEIADAVLANALTDLPRVVLLGIGKTFITGWRGRGPGLAPERVTGIRVPVVGRSVFASVRDSGTPHFGQVDPEEWTPALKAVLGRTPPECAVFPIRVGDDVAAFLYADRLGGPMPYEDFAKVARAAASAAGVLARFLLRANAPVA
jgi:hypothetical protein